MHRRPLASILAVATLCALLSAAGAATASTSRPAPPDHALTPTATARARGITAPGEAEMGWSQPAARMTPSRAGASRAAAQTQTGGIDVSSHQGNVSWSTHWAQGKKFAYVKATEGTSYTNPYFAQQYNGSYGVGMIRGAYHFALPASSSGTAQADWFVNHGGGWSRDGKTLPGVLDIEYNPYGSTCYGLGRASMRSWISAFTSRYKARTGREAVIYSTTDWWETCTGNTSRFSGSNPLWIARYSSTVGTLPSGWLYYTFWQYTSSPVDQNYFNGDLTRLAALARG